MVGFGHVPDGGFISSSGIGFGSDDLTGLAGADLSILEYYATTFGNYGADDNLLTDWWVYDPVDGHITGPNLTKADGGFASDSFGFDHDFNVTAADLASYYDDFRRTDEKMAKARRLRDALREFPHSNTYSPRGAKLSADGGFGGNDRIDLTDATNLAGLSIAELHRNYGDEEFTTTGDMLGSKTGDMPTGVLTDGLGPSLSSHPPATPASPVPPSPSIDGVAVFAPKLYYLDMVALADIDWTGVVLTDQSGDMLTGENITTTGDMLGYKTGDMLGPEFAKRLGIQLFADQPPPPPSPSPPPTSPDPPITGICCAVGAFVVFIVLLLAGVARVIVRRTPIIKIGATVYNYPVIVQLPDNSWALITCSQCATMKCDELMV